MKGIVKPATYIAGVIGVGLSAYWYVHERSLAAHPGEAAARSHMIVALGLLIVLAIGLVAICALDLRKFIAGSAEKWMLQGAAHTGPIAELEEAERLRAAGRPLDAIGVIREYLQEHPYELHVMARIAEIYRYDLHNDLAAALEYEELLKHKIPDDQWAWAALHLAKLYGRRQELEKSLALLERLDNEYDHTVAGRRAKKALEQVRNPDAQVSEHQESEPEQE